MTFIMGQFLFGITLTLHILSEERISKGMLDRVNFFAVSIVSFLLKKTSIELRKNP